MSTMQAARLVKPGEPLALADVPVPEPQPDEILVQVSACGLCGTDLHLAVAGDLPVEYTPITLGHETAGVVAQVGRDVTAYKEGDRVALFPAASCGQCRYCRAGRESLCDVAKVYGMSRDGGLAEYMTAPARSAVPLPDSIPFPIGAIATDGVATPFHALRSRANLRPGETLAVIGCGGLGTHAIMLGRLMGAAHIIAVDTDVHARARATALGADETVNPAETEAAKVIRSHTGGGVDVALECVGRPDTVELAIAALGKRGRAVLVGVGMGKPTLPRLVAFVGREQSVLGSFGMDRADIEDLFALVAAGRLDLSASVSARYPLARANDALQHLASKADGVTRVVVEPGA